jgi:hypothetical protein
MIQGRRITTGMPVADSRYRSLIVFSGREKVSEALRKNSIMAKHAATYPITNGITFLRFSSCQNWDIIF